MLFTHCPFWLFQCQNFVSKLTSKLIHTIKFGIKYLPQCMEFFMIQCRILNIMKGILLWNLLGILLESLHFVMLINAVLNSSLDENQNFFLYAYKSCHIEIIQNIFYYWLGNWLIEAERTWSPFCRWHFRVWKLLYFHSYLSEIIFEDAVDNEPKSIKWLGAIQVTSHCLNQWWPA